MKVFIAFEERDRSVYQLHDSLHFVQAMSEAILSGYKALLGKAGLSQGCCCLDHIVSTDLIP